MRRTYLILSAALCLCLYLLLKPSQAEVSTDITVWKNVTRGVNKSELRTVAVNPDNGNIVYAGSSDAVYKTMDGGAIWDEILTLRGKLKAINSIEINPLNTDIVYVGTRNGLYKTEDRGKNWKRIFNGIGEPEDYILSVAINPLDPEIVFIGTGGGLFRTDDGGGRWQKDHKLPSEAVISSVKIDPSNPSILYAATERGLYKGTDRKMGWERIFTTSEFEDSYGEGQAETEYIKIIGTEIESIGIDPSNTKTVYIGTSEGLFITEDAGLSWERSGSSGLTNSNIHHIAISPNDPDGVYAATSGGVFRYSKKTKSWREIYKGITSTKIRFLAFDPGRHQTLWAATGRGIFKTVKGTSRSARHEAASKRKDIIATEAVYSLFANEPSIREIQEAAIRYAEVHPEKIEKWRKAAKHKAWLPDLKVGYDKDKDWQSAGYPYKGEYIDDKITEGKDRAWSVSLTWELGDLIWNNDQTSIDTRSRLMVQLRDDVLNEVTRLYFERKRLQVEMFFSPAEDIKARIEQELRLQELTADIDALTGFYLSRSLAKQKQSPLTVN